VWVDFRRRVAFVVAALVVYFVGSDIPIPGFDPAAVKELLWGPGPGVAFDMCILRLLPRFS
jgi:preprotein translocase subunit SecY